MTVDFDIAEWAAELADVAPTSERFRRSVVQLADDLSRLSGRELTTLAPPDQRGQATAVVIAAALVEYRAAERRVAIPAWVPTVARASEPWHLSALPRLHRHELESSPAVLAARNIWICPESLESV